MPHSAKLTTQNDPQIFLFSKKAFNDSIVEMTVVWQLNTAFILTENFDSFGVHELNLIDKNHRELQIINKLENKIENGVIQVAAYFTTG